MNHAPDPLKDPRFTKLLSSLRGQETPEPSADFTAKTMARLRQNPAVHKPLFSFVLRATAAIALLLGASLWMLHPAPIEKSSSPIDILLAAQRSDGSWSADSQNLRPRYDTGVTALVLLALMHADSAALDGPPAAAIRSGMAHLLSQQGIDGRFGGDFSGAGFTHYLAGMALQAAARLPHADPAWQTAAMRATPHLPPGIQMAKLNNGLAHPEVFPARWANAGGLVTVAALELLNRYPILFH
jgi:hypothetical protein